ncbi:MAG: glycosyltransferase, partial [Candidatus Omnitrophota bacterium]
MKKKPPFVSIIIVNYNGKHLLGECLDSLLLLDYPKKQLEIIMVDNGSTDGSMELMKKNYPQVRVMKNKSNNYCQANNQAIRKARGEFLVLLNNDTKVEPDWLAAMVKVIVSNKKIGAVGSKILSLDGRIQSAGHAEFPYHYWGDKGFLEEDKGQYDLVREVKSVSNCSAMYRKAALRATGLFDEDFNMYMEDVDMAYRLRKNGWKIYLAPESRLFHKIHGSGQDSQEHSFYIEKNRLLFILKHFPEKLPEMVFGNGSITRLKPVYYQKLIADLFKKVVGLYGHKRAVKYIDSISLNIKQMQDYKEHCSRDEAEARLAEYNEGIIRLNKTVSQKEMDLSALQAALNEKEKKLQEMILKLGLIEEKTDDLNKTINAHKSRLTIIQDTLSEKERNINELTAQSAIKDEQIANLNKEAALKVRQLNSQAEDLLKTDRKLNELITQSAIKDEQIANLNKEAALKVRQLNSQA